MTTQEVNLSDLAHFLPRQLEATKAADDHTYTLYEPPSQRRARPGGPSSPQRRLP